MRLFTLLELKTKIQTDLDLQDEIFISPSELVGYIQEAVREAEAEVHTLYEDYFLTSDILPLQNGVSNYAMPTNIYLNKIRSILYSNGSDKYEILRFRGKLSALADVDSNDSYRYLPINSALNGYQMQLLPASRETSAANVTRWYIRTSQVLVNDADICDLPEVCINFVLKKVKEYCYEKEGHPNMLKASSDAQAAKVKMIETLSPMTDDENDSIPLDVSFYSDFDTI